MPVIDNTYHLPGETFLSEPTYDPLDALKLPLLFYAAGTWTGPQRDEWQRITGTREATTRLMCDHIRAVLGGGRCEVCRRPRPIQHCYEEGCTEATPAPPAEAARS